MSNKILARTIVTGIILGIVLQPIETFFGVLASVLSILYIFVIFILTFYLLRVKEEGFLLGVIVFLTDLFLRAYLFSQRISMPTPTIFLLLLSSSFTWYRTVLFPLSGFFGGLLGSRKISLKRLAFILSFTGTIFLTISGLVVVALTAPYEIGGFILGRASAAILPIGAGIIIFLLIGDGLVLSTVKSRVTAGSTIILIFSGISFIIGIIGIGILESISSNLYYYWGNITYSLIFIIKASFYGSIVLLLAGGIMGFAWKPPTSPPSPLSTSPHIKEIEAEIKKYEEYLEKLEQLKKEEKISEEAYEKLRTEYEEKLDKLVTEWKK